MPSPWEIQQMQQAPRAPDTGVQGRLPSAMTGGMLAEQNRNYRQDVAIQNEINKLILQKNQEAAAEYQRNADLREQEKLAALAKARAEAANVERLKAAEADIKGTEAAKGKGTLESDIASTNATNQGKIDVERMNQVERDAEDMYRTFSGEAGPDTMAKFTEWADKKGIKQDNPFRQMLQSSRNPQEFQQRLQQFRDKIVMDVKTQREMAKKSAELTQSGQNSKDVANIQAAAHRYSADQQLKAAGIRAAAGDDKPLTETQFKAKMMDTLGRIDPKKDDSQLTQDEKVAVEWGVRDARQQWATVEKAEGMAQTKQLASMPGKMGLAAKAEIAKAKAEFAAQLPPAVARRWAPSDTQEAAGEFVRGPDGKITRKK